MAAEDAELDGAVAELQAPGASVESVRVGAGGPFTETITLLMPGPTDTEFFERADMLDTKVGAGDKDDPADVARDGFEALMAGEERVVSASLSTKLQGRASRVLPDSAKATMHRRMAEPSSADG